MEKPARRTGLSVASPTKLERAAVAALYDHHAPALRRFLVGVLRDHQLAADVLQATFAKAAETEHVPRPEAQRAWLYRVAYRQAMAIRRREAVDGRAKRRLAWAREAAATIGHDPLVAAETVARVREALDGLPPEQAQVVRMRIYEEKTFAVIARELGIPLGTALGRMRTALKKLRKSLENDSEPWL